MGGVQAASALGAGVGKTTDNVLNGRPADKGVIESMAGGAAVGVGGQMVGELLPAPVVASSKAQAGATSARGEFKKSVMGNLIGEGLNVASQGISDGIRAAGKGISNLGNGMKKLGNKANKALGTLMNNGFPDLRTGQYPTGKYPEE